MRIRQAQLEDSDRVNRLYCSAFSEVQRDAVAGVAVKLLAEKTSPPTFSLIAETGDDLVGHVGFSPVALNSSDTFIGYILAPLAVHPALQKQGIGNELIGSGIGRLSSQGVDIVFVYGDPKYYGRFGFDGRVAADYSPPCQLQYEFGWQAKRLTELEGLKSFGKLTCVHSLMNPNLW